MTLEQLFTDTIGVYTPQMINNNWAIDLPYLLKGLFLLILLYQTFNIIAITVRGVFRKW